MKRWNIHILLAKPCLASKENITIEKLYGTIGYKLHLILGDHLIESVEKHCQSTAITYNVESRGEWWNCFICHENIYNN